MSKSSILFMVSMLLITSQSRALGAKSRPLEAVLDASTYPGSNFGSRVASAIAALPSWGGTVDARQLQGPQLITETVQVPKGVTVLLGAAQIQSMVTPAFTLSQVARLLGEQGTTASPGTFGPTGTVIWEDNAGDGPLIQVDPTMGATKAEIAELSLANVNGLASLLPNGAGTGIDLTKCAECSIHDLEIVGFNTNLYGSWGYYNNIYNIESNGFTSTGYDFETAWNSNTMVELNTQAPIGASAVGYLMNGATNTLMGGSCENYPYPGSYCLRMTAGGINAVLGHMYKANFNGTFLKDDSQAVVMFGTGNTVMVNGEAWQINGIPGTGGVGFPMAVADRVFKIGSGGSLNPTMLYTDPNPTDASMYEIDWYIVNTGGAASGSVSLATLYKDRGTQSQMNCAGMLNLAVANNFNSGSCYVYAAGGQGFLASASGGAGAAYTAAVSIRKIGTPD